METTSIITPRSISYSPKREVKPENKPLAPAEKRRLGDLHAISLIEEGLKTEDISIDEFLKFLRQ